MELACMSTTKADIEAPIVKMDETDEKILAYLRAHGRDSYRQVATKLKLHPATVIRRVEVMQKSGVIAGFGAQVDYLRMGYEFMALMEIRCAPGHIAEAGVKLKTQAGVVSVWDITGVEDMMILIACKTRTEFNKTIKHIGTLPYVDRTITHVILNVLKSEREFEL